MVDDKIHIQEKGFVQPIGTNEIHLICDIEISHPEITMSTLMQ